jgi:hypothetical protein
LQLLQAFAIFAERVTCAAPPTSGTFGVPNFRISATPLAFVSGIAEILKFTPTNPLEPLPLEN